MTVIQDIINLKTAGLNDVIDITERVAISLTKTKLKDGLVTVFIPGSTAGITTVEFEQGVVQDLKDAFERIASAKDDYAHNVKWGDGNGFSHVRAALQGGSFTVPFSDSSLVLGTWQQIVLIDFDNRPRDRRIILQFIGE